MTTVTKEQLKKGTTFYSTSSDDHYVISDITVIVEQGQKKPTKRTVYVFDLYQNGELFQKDAFKTTYESINDLLKNAWKT